MATPLHDAQYISLRTYRRDGTPVDTPIWQAPLEGRLVAYTDGRSFKVKRLQRNDRVQVARCDIRGRLEGPWFDGRCEIVERGSEFEKRAYQALRRKYGLVFATGLIFSTLARRRQYHRVLAIALDESSGQASETVGV